MALITITDFNASVNTAENIAIDRTELVALVSDAYFQDQDNWARIFLRYDSQNSNQTKTIDVTGDSGFVTFTDKVRQTPDWIVNRITIYDYDNDHYNVTRATIPSVSNYDMNIVSSPESFSYVNNQQFIIDTPITPITPTVLGEDIVFTSDPLPTGLSLNPSTGEISGTPTVETAEDVYQITATNSYGFATFDLTITVYGSEYYEDAFLIGTPGVLLGDGHVVGTPLP